MKIFFRTPALIFLGALIVYLSLAVASGSFANAGTIVVASIICTLGISLLIWIPLCWCIGWIVFEICSLAFGKERMRRAFGMATSDASQSEANSYFSNLEPSPEPNPELLSPVLNRQRIILVDYIGKAKRQGLSDTQISSRLKAQGWDDIEIQQAQSFVREALEDN
jgi:hypothetical protein